MTIARLQSDFELLDDWEDRYRYIIELGRTLKPLPDALRTEATKVARLHQPGLGSRARDWDGDRR